MKLKIFCAILLSLSFCMTAAQVTVKGCPLTAVIDTQGATLAILKSGNLSLQVPNEFSFADKLLRNGGESGRLVQYSENFGKLQFTVDAVNDERNSFSVALSARGVGVMANLRLRKTYVFAKNKPEFTVKYSLLNCGEKSETAGFWTKTFLRLDDGFGLSNTICQARGKKFVRLVHPGPVKSDEISVAPELPVIGVFTADSRGIIMCLPEKMISAYYSWMSSSKMLSTAEYFLREQRIAAGATLDFSVHVAFGNDVPAKLAAYEKNVAAVPGQGDKLFFPDNIAGLRKVSLAEATPAAAGEYADFSFQRQYEDSVRGVLFPANFPLDKFVVYATANGREDDACEVPAIVRQLANGEKRLLIRVPGVSKRGFYYTEFKNGFFRNENDLSSAPVDGKFTCRVFFGKSGKKSWPASIFPAAPTLILNGSFEQKSPDADWPDGFFWSYAVRGRKNFFWDRNNAKNGNFGMRIERPNKFWAIFPVFFVPEKGAIYTASAWVRCDNEPKDWATSDIGFYGADKKRFSNKRNVSILSGKESFGWKKIEKTFSVPEDAAFAAFNFAVFAPGQAMYIDDIDIVPADTRFMPLSPREAAREQLINGFYKPLNQLENISHSVETPHVKWFKPAAVKPEILYLCAVRNSVQDTERRQIVELAQRMDLTCKYIPLLRKIRMIHGDNEFGIVPAEFEPVLENYTMESLREIKNAPQLIIVQAVNFKNQVQKEFISFLRGKQQQGSSLLFHNCENIPAELLGKKIPTPPSLWLVPQLRKVSQKDMDNACAVYSNGNAKVMVFDRSDAWYWKQLWRFPSVPSACTNEGAPAYFSKDFPYWEYIYLTLVKGVNYLVGNSGATFERAAATDGRIDFMLHAGQTLSGRLSIDYKDMNRNMEKTVATPVELKKGDNRVGCVIPELPGGEHIAEYRLLNAAGKVVDAGALYFTTPELCRIAVPQYRVFPRGGQIVFPVQVTGAPAGAELLYRVENSDNNIIASGRMPVVVAGNKVVLEAAPPYTVLNRVLLQVTDGKRVIGRTMGEYSTPPGKTDPHEYYGLIWVGRFEMTKPLADLGMDMFVGNYPHDGLTRGYFRNIVNAGMEPVQFGSGNIFYPQEAQLLYRHDGASDPVRNPCYSDPAFWEKSRNKILANARDQHYNYFNVRNHYYSDEAFLGSSVCYSPHCLRDFRKKLQQEYPSLAALNRAWGSSFAAWDDVTPSQINALKDKNRLAPWLDHKMFMAGVFANKWVGLTAKYLREAVPGSMSGLSGTQMPGLGYDWAQLMKHIDFLAYYSGVQCKLVHDFAAPGFVSGQWGGGYMPAHRRAEAYQRAPQWSHLFLGANVSPNWTGGAMNGDLTPNPGFVHYLDTMRELKRGAGKLVVSAPQTQTNIAVLYSQASLFAAMGSFGGNIWHNSQTGWDALLTDLKYNYRFITYEQLAAGISDRELKVIVLPCAVALSDREIASLERFVKSGGTLVADFGAGIFDQHGNRREDKAIQKLFGLPDKRDATLTPTAETLKINGVTDRFQRGEKSLPVALERQLGKGRTVWLNILFSGYQDVSLEGVGGELSQIKSGAQLFCENLRRIAGAVLEQSGVRPSCKVTDAASGKLYPCQTTLRRDGDNYVFGLIKFDTASEDLRQVKAHNLKVELPVSGHIYDVRAGKYIGAGNNFVTSAVPGDAKLFTVLRDKPGAVTLTMPEKVRRGTVTEAKIALPQGSGSHVFRLEVLSPSGIELPRYTVTLRGDAKAGVAYRFRFALSDLPGKYTLRAVDVNSGVTATKKIILE